MYQVIIRVLLQHQQHVHVHGIAGVQNVVHEDWQSCAEAISTALHPDVTQLIRLLNRIAIATTPLFLHPASAFMDMSRHVEQVLSLQGVACWGWF